MLPHTHPQTSLAAICRDIHALHYLYLGTESACMSVRTRRLLGEADHILDPDAATAERTLQSNRLVQRVRIGGTCVPIMAGSWFAEAVEAL